MTLKEDTKKEVHFVMNLFFVYLSQFCFRVVRV